VPQTGQAQTFQVSITDNAFDPPSLTIPAGSTVVWTHNGSNPHTVSADDDTFSSENLSGGDTFSHTFDQPGTVGYFCAIHGGPGGAGMSAEIIVTAAPTAAPATLAATAPATASATAAATAAATSPAGAATATTGAPAAVPTATQAAAAQPTAAGGLTFQLLGAFNRDPAQASQTSALAVGTTIAGELPNLWATWSENTPGGARQIFVSERATEAFQARGASLNIHANVLGEFPTITFAGENRLVPWVAWAEPSPGFGNVVQIFASRFNQATGLWQPAGQDRGGGEPTINLHTNRPANHPFIFSGAGDPTKSPTP